MQLNREPKDNSTGGVSITKAHQAVPDLKNIVPKVPE